jgi:tetratricopeptide (TPR) repeat protein
MIRKNSPLILLILFVLSGLTTIASNPNKEKALELFSQRQEKAKLEESIKVMEEIISKEKDYEIAVLLSRAYYVMAEHAENNQQRLDLYDKGVKAGEAALNMVPHYIASFTSSKKEEDAVKSVTNEHIDAVYWTAANLARWAKFTSFTKKISSKARVKYLWDKSAELNPEFFYGGSYRFYGGYFALVPTITGEQDPLKSKENFDKAIAAAPEYLETKVLMAEAYCTHQKIKDRELFKKLLNEVISADLSAHPGIYAENLIAQGKAKKMLEDEKNLFE